MPLADRAKIDRIAKLNTKERAFLADRGHQATNAAQLTDEALDLLRTVAYAPVSELRWHKLRVARAALTTGTVEGANIRYTAP